MIGCPACLEIPSRYVVTSHLRHNVFISARWGSCSLSECVRDSCRNQNKWAQQNTQKDIDAYSGSKKKKIIIYELGTQHCTNKMFQHDCNVILYNSNSINKKLKLSDLHFRHNIDCFCSISLMKIFQSKLQQNCFVSLSEPHSGVSLLNKSTFLNESSESMIQQTVHKDRSHLTRFWLNQPFERVCWIKD